MVLVGDLGDRPRQRRLGEDVGADLGVLLDQRVLQLVQPTWPREDLGGYRDLADIVHDAALADQPRNRVVEAEFAGDGLTETTHAQLVARGVGVAVLSHARKGGDRAVERAFELVHRGDVRGAELDPIRDMHETLDDALAELEAVARRDHETTRLLVEHERNGHHRAQARPSQDASPPGPVITDVEAHLNEPGVDGADDGVVIRVGAHASGDVVVHDVRGPGPRDDLEMGPVGTSPRD